MKEFLLLFKYNYFENYKRRDIISFGLKFEIIDNQNLDLIIFLKRTLKDELDKW